MCFFIKKGKRRQKKKSSKSIVSPYDTVTLWKKLENRSSECQNLNKPTLNTLWPLMLPPPPPPQKKLDKVFFKKNPVFMLHHTQTWCKESGKFYKWLVHTNTQINRQNDEGIL